MQAVYNAKTLPSVPCKQNTSNAHLLLVACVEFVRGGYNHVKELYTITQRRLHVVVEITRWQPCCLQRYEACHLLRVLFGNSDLQPSNTKSQLHIPQPSLLPGKQCIAVNTLASMESTHLKAHCSTVQTVKWVIAVLWLSVACHGVNLKHVCQLCKACEHLDLRCNRQPQGVTGT